ncbi:hypothetical protein KP509_20G017100 [Ceratopteris richardii]|nr:hypothetical protein KP509_20G017100 [Ceratopteris richardii]
MVCPSGRQCSFFTKRFLCLAREVKGLPEAEGVLSKRALLEREGFTEEHIKAVLNLGPRSDKLKLLLIILKELGIHGPGAGSFISDHTWFLQCNLWRLHERLQILENAGVESSMVKEALSYPSYYFSSRVSNEELRVSFSNLKDIGLSPSESFMAIFRSSKVKKVVKDENWVSRFQALYRKGMSTDRIRKTIQDHACLLRGSKEFFTEHLQLMEEIGLDINSNSAVRALVSWSAIPADVLRAKFTVLICVGYSHEEAKEFVRRYPVVLSLKEEDLIKRFDFLLHTANLKLKEICCSATFLTCNLEKRIIPRFKILQYLKEHKLLRKEVTLSYAVAISDDAFAKRFKVPPQVTANASLSQT